MGHKIKGDLCLNIKKKLVANKNESFNCATKFTKLPRVQVTSLEGQTVISMENKTCACRRHDLTGILYMHACYCILKK